MNFRNIYFVTDDTYNIKNKILIHKLESYFNKKISIISPRYSKINPYNIRQVQIKTNDFLANFMSIWSKISFLLSKVKNTKTDYEFPKRNIYSGSIVSRKIVNFFWYVKRIDFINNLLPNYDKLFILPLFFLKKQIKQKDRLFIIDSLTIRYFRFSEFIKILYNSNSTIFINVNSWDNPFYSQFFSIKTTYVVWSDNMLKDINVVHKLNLKKENIIKIGPYPFYSFYKTRNNSKRIDFNKKINLGYACAFCDLHMMKQEFKLINKISKFLRPLNLNILVRPYPSIPIEEYNKLTKNDNIIIYHPKKMKYLDRFGDGREKIFFSADEERHCYNKKCDIFLSIATSYTIEAAIDKKPIIQFYLNKNDRVHEFEKDFFLRFDISDHLIKYYLKNLKIVNDYESLASLIAKVLKVRDTNEFIGNNDAFLNSLGFKNF